MFVNVPLPLWGFCGPQQCVIDQFAVVARSIRPTQRVEFTWWQVLCNPEKMVDIVQEIRKLPNFLDHFFVFVTVFEEGSLSAASRKLNRAVSTISYSIKKLEEQAGCPLLIRKAPRVELTSQGASILVEARALIDQTMRLSAHMRALDAGQEPELRILVDVLFPREVLARTLTQFAQTNARVRLQLFHASLNTMWDDLRDGDYDLALTLTNQVPLELTSKVIARQTLSTYCASTHRLAELPQPLTAADYRRERQIYFVGRPEIEVERVGRVFSPDIWTVDDIEMLRQMVIRGLGWSFGTEDTFAAEVASGQIVPLHSNSPNMQTTKTVNVVWTLNRAPGVLGQAFVDFVEEAIQH